MSGLPPSPSLLTFYPSPIPPRIWRGPSPQRVILFGSHARDSANETSDVDLLIVGDRNTGAKWNRRQEIGRIRRDLPSLGVPIDIILVSPDEIEKWSGTTNHIIAE